jgi:F1F0 ATPase subunit 2
MTPSLTAIALGALTGAALGAVYLALLWSAVRRLPAARGGFGAFLGLALARFALLLGALAASAALGLPAEGIAAALGGFILLRVAATRRIERTQPEGRTWR